MSDLDSPTGDHPFDDVAAYALHALDDVERRAVDDHLTGCVACRDELATHYETLALLAPEEAPPASAWERVTAGIGAPAERDEPGRPSRFGWMAVAAGVAVALGMGGVAGYGLGSSDGDDADIGTLAERAAEQPGGELATLVSPDGDSVARVVADDDGAYLVLEELENLPTGRAYQLWSVTEAQPVSLGMLGRDGTNTVAFRLPPTITDLAISEAPTSGDVTPRGEFIAAGAIPGT